MSYQKDVSDFMIAGEQNIISKPSIKSKQAEL